MSTLGLFTGLVTSVLHEADGCGLSLLRVSLTFHPDELDEHWPWQAADLFSEGVAREGHPAGALLGLDVSPRWRAHFYGLALSWRTPYDLDQLWHRVARHLTTRADLANRVRLVTGSGGPWSPPNRTLSINLARVCRYLERAEGWPRAVPKPSVLDRVITSGAFASFIPSAPPPTGEPVMTPLALVTHRLMARARRECEFCRAPLPEAARADRRTCSRRCRVRKHREDRAAGGAL